MPYNELIKNYSRIRDYMREFFVYGFKIRNEYDKKSARSYDNERRRIESWLSDYMAFRQDAAGKNVFLSVDSRNVPHNPLYQSWKAASFTKNDISLHFLLLDIVTAEQPLSVPEILDRIDRGYLPLFQKAAPIDESTLRKKLKEYEAIGLIETEKKGKQLLYRLPEDEINLEAWQDALSFFAEENPLGVVGSFLMDRLGPLPEIFSFKHHYLLFTLDSGILLDLLLAMREHRRVELEILERQGSASGRTVVLPMKIYISTQGGRQYLYGFNSHTKKLCFYRLDSIQKVRALEAHSDYDTYRAYLRDEQQHVWGVSNGNRQLERIEMWLRVLPEDHHIAHRLQREQRCGTVTQLDEVTWRFTAEVYDAQELLPWLRTFIGRIERLTCSNKMVEERFWSDYALMCEIYGGDQDAVQ